MNVALIGYGYWGKIIEPYIKEYFSIKYIANSTFDKDIIWNDKSIKAVFIITPVDTHFEITKEALLYDKHVFVEKPLTTSYSEAKELHRISLLTNKQIVTDYIYTFSKGLKLLQKAIKYNIQYIESSSYQLGKYTNQSVFTVLGSHHLSILDLFLDISKISFDFIPISYKNNICTTGRIVWKLGNIFLSLDKNVKNMSIVLYTSENVYRYNPKFGIKSNNSSYNIIENNNLKYAIQYFKDVIEEKNISNIERSLKVTKIIGEI